MTSSSPSAGGTPPPAPAVPRRRNAAASRAELLAAASVLFAERGYSRTTLRQVAARAGLDAALVVRYFGSKDGLYQAVLAEDWHATLPESVQSLDPGEPQAVAGQLVDRLLTRWETEGVGPLVLSLSRPQVDEGTRREVRKLLADAILNPLAQSANEATGTDSQLRAEVVLAALCGIGTTRSVGSLSTLTAAERSTLEPIMRAIAVAVLRA